MYQIDKMPGKSNPSMKKAMDIEILQRVSLEPPNPSQGSFISSFYTLYSLFLDIPY